MKKNIHTGIFTIVVCIVLLACNSGTETPPPATVHAPDIMSFSIVKAIPHDTTSFTEGLLVYNGSLYESTGNNGKSKLRQIDLNTGKVEKEIKLDSTYFGEGIAILRDTVYQLTYKQQIAFVYTLKDFKKIKEVPFETDTKEGWGMTTDGTYLIASDGSSNLYYYEPSTFKLVKKIPVTDAGTLSYNVNELEYIDGYLYANQWQLPYLLKIDTSDGHVVAKVDLTDLWNSIKQKDPHAEVLNGIAYDAASKKTYVTGKWWPELYEIQFSK